MRVATKVIELEEYWCSCKLLIDGEEGVPLNGNYHRDDSVKAGQPGERGGGVGVTISTRLWLSSLQKVASPDMTMLATTYTNSESFISRPKPWSRM